MLRKNPATSFHEGLRSPENEILPKVTAAEASGKGLMGQQFRTSWPAGGGDGGGFSGSVANKNWECPYPNSGSSNTRHDIDRSDQEHSATVNYVDRNIDTVAVPADGTRTAIFVAGPPSPNAPSGICASRTVVDEFARADGRHQRARIQEDPEFLMETSIVTDVKGCPSGGKRKFLGR